MCISSANDYKIALVTGGSSGLGKAAAIELARQKVAVFILCRDEISGLKTVQEIQTASGSPHISFFTADLSSQKSIHRLVDQIFKELPKLDILIHAAGTLQPSRISTIDGLETTFAVNHLASFLLTQKLLPLLRASSSARILVLSSRAEELGNIDFDDLQMHKSYSAIKSYCQSKLANILFTYELARKLEKTKITVNCLHPGLVNTNLGRNLPILIRTLIWCIRPFMTHPSRAIEPVIRLALDPQFEGVSGKYFLGTQEGKSSPKSYDPVLAKRLWEMSEQLTQSL